MFQRASGVTVAVLCLSVLCTSAAQGAFMGADFVFDAARTAALNGNADTTGDGNDVYLLFAAFSDPNDRFLNIFNVNFDAGATLFQHGNGNDLPANSSFFGLAPDLEYDSYVTVGSLLDTTVGTGLGVDGNGINFTATGMTGNSGWFTTPPTGLGTPVFNADLGIFTVVLAQITVAAGPRAVFTGDYEMTFSTSSTIGSFAGGYGFFPIPTPGSVALIGIAGLLSSTRRKRH